MRRRGRRWLIAALVAVTVLALLVVADRVGASVAANVAERQLTKQAAFSQSPSVQINGFPFLTQAIRGRYDDVEIHGKQVSLDGVLAADRTGAAARGSVAVVGGAGRPRRDPAGR